MLANAGIFCGKKRLQLALEQQQGKLTLTTCYITNNQHFKPSLTDQVYTRGMSDAAPMSPRFSKLASPTGQAGAAPVMLLVAGPGSSDWNRHDISELAMALDKSGIRVVTVGDGETPLSIRAVGKKIQQLHEQGLPVQSILHLTHGKLQEDGSLGLRFHGKDGDKKTLSNVEQYFDTINSANGKQPIDVILLSCHGGAAHEAAHRLPPGSQLLSMVDRHNQFDLDSLQRFVKYLDRSEKHLRPAGIESFLTHYLSSSSSTDVRDIPMISRSGDNTVTNIGQDLEEVMGKPLPPEQRHLLQEKLRPHWGEERTDGWIERLERAQSSEWLGIYEQGPLLLMAYLLKHPEARTSHLPVPPTEQNPGTEDRRDWVGIDRNISRMQDENGNLSLLVRTTDGRMLNIPYPATNSSQFLNSYRFHDSATNLSWDYALSSTGIKHGQPVLSGTLSVFDGRYMIITNTDYSGPNSAEIVDTLRGEVTRPALPDEEADTPARQDYSPFLFSPRTHEALLQLRQEAGSAPTPAPIKPLFSVAPKPTAP